MTDAAIQRALAALGLCSGKIEGVIGPVAKTEIVAFQRRRGLLPDGIAGPEARRTLQAVIAQPGAPVPALEIDRARFFAQPGTVTPRRTQ